MRPHGASRTGHVLSERLAHSGTQATEPKQEAMFSGKKDKVRPGAADGLSGTGCVTAPGTLDIAVVVR